ncbi:MAG: hypothetical protein EBZ61_12075 [Micrococcales bacterium]|nr:hypothetical protein [Micrococcales bacterium]
MVVVGGFVVGGFVVVVVRIVVVVVDGADVVVVDGADVVVVDGADVVVVAVLLELALATQRRTLPTRVHTSVRPATTRRLPTTEHDAASAGAVANSPAPSARAMTSAADRRTCAIRGIQRLDHLK